MTRDWTQIAMQVAVDYQENSDRIIGILQQIGAELRNDQRFREAIVADPQVPGIDRVTGNEVDYLMLVKTRPGQQYAVSRELRRRIKECFERNHIRPGGQNRYFVVDSKPAHPRSSPERSQLWFFGCISTEESSIASFRTPGCIP